MGLFDKMCFGGPPGGDDEEARKRSAAIDKELATDRKKMGNTVKMLLLGAGESGKTTIHKQMMIIYKGGFQKDDREEYRAVVINNLTTAFGVILREMTEYNISFSNPQNQQYYDRVVEATNIEPGDKIDMAWLPIFKSLIQDSGVQASMERGNEYALQDNFPYFVQSLDRIFAQGYTPNDEDILRARLRTTGIKETIFELGELTYRLFDVGGQRSERRKWFSCFDGVDVMLFLASISGYDQCLIEDRSSNQMDEALQLFESLANSAFFQKSAIILFLNKTDLFEQKVLSGQHPINRHWSAYNGAPGDVKAGKAFFEKLFRSKIQDPSKTLYVHFTNATDTTLLRKIMGSVQDDIAQKTLKKTLGDF